VRYISTIARLKRIAVIMTIHQPSATVFNMMDAVLLVAAGGRMAFNGSVPGCLRFFAAHGVTPPEGANPADFFLAAITDKTRNWKAQYAAVFF
jgi:ABC-type multidrug transport system ATPase subunit